MGGWVGAEQALGGWVVGGSARGEQVKLAEVVLAMHMGT